MTSRLRELYQRCLAPVVVLLARWGVSPTAVTVAGTVATVAAALWFLPRGQAVLGTVVVLVCLLGDGLDGQLARFSGRESRLGAFLDSTLDRMADAAILVGIGWWRLVEGDALGLGLSLAVLVMGFLVSYARARAEAEGWDASVGLFERADRLLLSLAGVLAVGLGAPEWALWLALGVVALGSAVTVGQRIAAAARAAPDAP
ncbi:MAG TPA: CDP-alcohol phosphatidyltransferase family protein [Arachnia sp.]|nr:CDP-alcohol phosphatidyltransferase family protein [Arachnia sp.]HMT86443.1 CDP-alcohol phosphatidyltransferase family protein [Arachnia sp.]